MKTKLFIFSFICLFIISCSKQKFIFKNNEISKNKMLPTTPMATDILETYEVDRGFKSKIEIKDNFIIIKDLTESNYTSFTKNISTTTLSAPPKGAIKDFIGKFYYSDTSEKPFKYFESKPILQALVIPIKIRPKLENVAFPDSFPSQTETGFNPALAFGWKMSINSISSKKDLFGKNNRQWSLTPGLFLGTGAVDLKKATTRSPIITFDRKAAIVSTGGFITIGLNYFNIGYSFGWDYATGSGKESWIYQGKMWHGITISISDIIK